MLADFSFARLQIMLLVALLMVLAAVASPVQALGAAQETERPPEPSVMTFDSTQVNGYMAECQSVAAGSLAECMDYAFTLAGTDVLAAIPVQSKQFALIVNGGARDGSMLNEYMAECQSVTAGSLAACMDYAINLAGTDTPAATTVLSEQFTLTVIGGARDGSMINEYMAECQSVNEGSMVECMNYAIDLAAPNVK